MTNANKKIYILERVYDGEILTPSFFSSFKEAQDVLVEYFCGRLYDEQKLKPFMNKNGDIRNVDFDKLNDWNMYPSYNLDNEAEIGHGYCFIDNCGPTNSQYIGEIKEVAVSILDEVIQKMSDMFS